MEYKRFAGGAFAIALAVVPVTPSIDVSQTTLSCTFGGGGSSRCLEAARRDDCDSLDGGRDRVKEVRSSGERSRFEDLRHGGL